MAKINITVDIDDLFGEAMENEESFSDTFRNEIIREIVNKYTNNIDRSVLKEAENKIKEFDVKVSEKIEEAINKKIEGIMDDFLNRKINLYDRYGDMKREGVVIIDLLKEKMDKFMTEGVDKDGNTKGYGPKIPRIDYIINKNITYDMQRHVEKAASEVKEKLENYIKEELKKNIGDKMMTLLELNKK